MIGFKATSAPEHAIASADNTLFAFAEIARRELMFTAHAITIALSKNKAQSDNNKAAPSFELDLAEGFFTKTLLIRRSPQRDNSFPRTGCIGPTHANLHQRRQASSACPSRQPDIRIRIEIGDFKTRHILNQRHPGFLSFCSVRIVLRLAQKAKVEFVLFFAT